MSKESLLRTTRTSRLLRTTATSSPVSSAAASPPAFPAAPVRPFSSARTPPPPPSTPTLVLPTSPPPTRTWVLERTSPSPTTGPLHTLSPLQEASPRHVLMARSGSPRVSNPPHLLARVSLTHHGASFLAQLSPRLSHSEMELSVCLWFVSPSWNRSSTGAGTLFCPGLNP